MNVSQSIDLEELAWKVRRRIVRISGRSGAYIGSALSCADILTFLYTRYLNVSPQSLDDPDRDVLLLSKGHAVAALYATLAELGFFGPDHPADQGVSVEPLYHHPHPDVPGVEFFSGSLGHLLPVGVGVALSKRLAGRGGRVVVITGDGELDEGSNWEALLVASAHRLDGLTIIVDRNRLQANVPTESLIPLEPLTAKFAAFGAQVVTVDGHDFAALEAAFEQAHPTGRPRVVIADTVRGKSIPSIEERVDRWFMAPSESEVTDLLGELDEFHWLSREMSWR